MSEQTKTTSTRRDFLVKSGTIAAASTLVATSAPHVHAAEDNTIQIALVGCGGRGTGAVVNALSVQNGPIKLVAMADVFEDRLAISYRSLSTQLTNKVDVPDDRKFIGFEAYKQAIDCLKPGDVVIFTTPCAFRWLHFTYAIEKGVNVFMEKPISVDGPSSKKMIELGKQSVLKNLKVSADERIGVDIILRSLESPTRQIVENAGVDGSIVVQNVADSSDYNYGFNAATEKYEDLVKSGVIDPTKVVRTALQDASSVAGLLITTEAMVAEVPEKKESAGAPPDMGGMGGMGGF